MVLRSTALVLGLTAATSLALLVGPGASRAEPPSREQVAELLTHGVEKPASLGRLRGGDAAEVAALVTAYEDGNLPRHARLRALGVLADSPRPEARAYLRRLVQAAAAPPMSADALHPARAAGVLLRALRGFRRSPAGLSASELAGCLRHGQAAVRAEAVLLLKAHGSPAARSLLEAHGAREQSPRVQAALRAAP